LIDKELSSGLTDDERAELDHLQLHAAGLVRAKAPYPNAELDEFISQLKAEGKWDEPAD